MDALVDGRPLEGGEEMDRTFSMNVMEYRRLPRESEEGGAENEAFLTNMNSRGEV